MRPKNRLKEDAHQDQSKECTKRLTEGSAVQRSLHYFAHASFSWRSRSTAHVYVYVYVHGVAWTRASGLSSSRGDNSVTVRRRCFHINMIDLLQRKVHSQVSRWLDCFVVWVSMVMCCLMWLHWFGPVSSSCDKRSRYYWSSQFKSLNLK